MERREFLTKAGVAGLAAVTGGAAMAQDGGIERQPGESDVAYRTRLAQIRAAGAARAAQTQEQPSPQQPGESDVAYRTRLAQFRQNQRLYYELRRYEFETEQQKTGFDKFMSEAAIPALNRLNIQQVGVFCPMEGISPVYVFLRHISLLSFVTLTERLAEDAEFLEKGADFIDAPADAPAYKNMEVQLMIAFEGMRRPERPVDAEGLVIDGPNRVFQLRIYESPSEKTGLKKIEMFNTAEIAIFRKVGLNPVFFGQTLAGTKMPNLTYMLGFKDMEASKAAWKAFGGDPDWQKLRAMPEYADKAILRQKGITNLYLKPASYSQI